MVQRAWITIPAIKTEIEVADMLKANPRLRRRGCLIIGCLPLVIGLLIVIAGGVIAAPALFRALPLQYQNGLARRVAILNTWVLTDTPAPTRSYTSDYLPTANPVSAAQALALLNTPVPPTATPIRPTAVLPTGAPITATSAQVGATATTAIATQAATNAAAPLFTSTPTLIPTDVATATPSAVPLPPVFHLGGYKVIYQGWNNCGPANLAQVLNAYGVSITQDQTSSWLKPSLADKNVGPWRINYYVNTHTSMRAILRYGGNLDLIKLLLNAKFRPLIETGFTIPTNPKEGWMGHYLTPAGYDDSQSTFYGFDTYLGDGPDHRGNPEDYTDLDTRWEQFNRVYIVVYPASRESELMRLLGPDADPAQNLQRTLDQAKQEAQANPQNPFAWFNIGTTEVLLKNFQAAATAYDQARNAGSGLPWRMLWYQFGPLEAYYATGNYDTALQLISATLGTTSDVEEMFYWRGMIEAAQGNAKAAIADFHSTLNFNPNYMYASEALKAVQNGQVPTLPDAP